MVASSQFWGPGRANNLVSSKDTFSILARQIYFLTHSRPLFQQTFVRLVVYIYIVYMMFTLIYFVEEYAYLQGNSSTALVKVDDPGAVLFSMSFLEPRRDQPETKLRLCSEDSLIP